MYRDINSKLDVNESIRPQVATAGVNGEGVDLLGSDSCIVAATIGAITGAAGDGAVTLEESVDNITFTDVADADILGTEPAALAANTAYQFGYIGAQRYVRAVLSIGGETNIAAAVIVTRGDLARSPAEAPRSNALA